MLWGRCIHLIFFLEPKLLRGGVDKYLKGAIVFVTVAAGGSIGLSVPPPYTIWACIAAALTTYVLATAYRYTFGDKRNQKLVLVANLLRRTGGISLVLVGFLALFSLFAFVQDRQPDVALVLLLSSAACGILFLIVWYAATQFTARYARPTGGIAIRVTSRPDIAQKILVSLIESHRQTDGHFHIETILTEIGALAGFAAQMAVWKLAPETLINTQKEKHGKHYWFGHGINTILFEAPPPATTVWRVVRNTTSKLSPEEDREITNLLKHTISSMDTGSFGVPRLPREHMPHKLPQAALNENWMSVRKMLVCEKRKPEEWPFDLALAARLLIDMSKHDLAPELAERIFLEAAVPMSRVDSFSVPGAWAKRSES